MASDLCIAQGIISSAKQMNAPFFSIVIPSYNRAMSICCAVDSVLAQSFTDFEVLVIDDGSSDNTAKVLAQYENTERVRVFSQTNQGASSARNNGIKRARGKYIGFLDSDDTYTANHLVENARMIETEPQVRVFSCLLSYQRGHTHYCKPFVQYRKGDHVAEYLLCARGSFLTCSLIVESQLAKQVLFDSSISYGDDQDFAIRLDHAGAKFKQLSHVGGLIDDAQDNTRLSQNLSLDERQRWLDQIRPIIGDRAYFGDKGWVLAKAQAQNGLHWKATKNFSRALFFGCYNLKTAAIVAIQIYLPSNWYYFLSTKAAKLLRAAKTTDKRRQ